MNPRHEPSILRGRRHRRRSGRSKRSFGHAVAGAAAAPVAYPGYFEPDESASTRRFVTGSALLHAAALAGLLFLASLTPGIDEVVIPVQLLREEAPAPPPPPEALEPAPAPKALAMRRNLPYAPSVQAVAPQIVNPQIVAEARPAVVAEAFEMEAVGTSVAPTRVERRTAVVERVSAVNAAVRARVADVDVGSVSSPAVRGPTRVEGPVGPSVGPRKVEGAIGTSVGTAPLQIGKGNGSSVREGVIGDRDVAGSPEGALVVSIDTSLGQSELAGSVDAGPGTQVMPRSACMERPAVRSYLGEVKNRTIQRWLLPPGIDSGLKVTLRFQLDAAGSASKISIVDAQHHALGASAVDALRSAAPFPPMPDEVRCLARLPIVGTFSNPVGG